MLAKIGIAIGGTAIATSITTAILVFKMKKDLDKKTKEQEDAVKKVIGSTDKAIRDLAEATPVDIREDIVKRAIDKAVDREVRFAVDGAVRDVKASIGLEIDREVRAEIKTQRDRVIDDVDRKLVDEVAKISKDDISRDVQRKVTDMIIDRMDKDLSDIRDRYARKLDDSVKDITRSYRNKLDLAVNDWDRSYVLWKLGNV